MEASRSSRQQRPAYPQQQASASSTAPLFQSSSSLTSLSSSVDSRSSHMAAPLPSPSVDRSSMPHFPSFSAQQQQPPPTSHPSSQQQSTSATSAAYVGQRGQDGGMPSTAPFLKDFNLLAEAAKRAQMACLSRDLGDIGL